MPSPTQPGRLAQLCLRLLATTITIAAAPLCADAANPDLKPIAARAAALPAAPRLELADLLRRPQLQEVHLAPDGKHLAYLLAAGKEASLMLHAVDTGATRTLLTGLGRVQLSWSSDSSTLFLDDGASLSAVTTAGGSAVRLASFDRKREQQFLLPDPVLPHHGLVEEFDRAGHAYQLERIGLDGTRTPLYSGPRKVQDLLLDAHGELAFIETMEDDFTPVVAHREQGKWVEFLRCQRHRACSLVTVSGDGRTLTMILPEDGDRKALYAIDTRTRARRLVSRDPLGVSDLRRVVLDPQGRQPRLAVYDLPRVRNIGLDAGSTRAAHDLARRFPDTDIAISPAADTWLLTETGATLQQPRYWLYDPAHLRAREVLAAERAAGQPAAPLMAANPVTWTASDGMPLHGYLTLPAGQEARKLGLVTLVHGGPWNHLDSRFHWLMQLLANRGYAVFAPNFRSSTGYGDKYMLAAGEAFGNDRVQRDIIEGVQWLTANGIGDPARLAILGDSFGGYSTLLALTHTPDMFQFGMATVPPPNFARALRSVSGDTGNGDSAPLSLTLADMGIRYNDEAAMRPIEEAAPEHHPERVVRPLLILAGGKDQIVDIATVTRYVARLQELGKSVTLLVDPDEGHHARAPITREAYAYLLERMLQRYLGGAAPAAATPELKAYLERNLKANAALP
jgi:dipeptidyl aminopeptidase/acylaminoacyl peptidase